MTTRARSGTPASPFHDRRYDETGDDEDQREERDHLPARERTRVIAQLETARIRAHRDRQERMIATQDLSRPAIDEHVARIARRWLELDAHFPRIPRSHAGARRRRGRQPAERRWVDG